MPTEFKNEPFTDFTKAEIRQSMESALKKVTEGRTTLREINKVTFVE